MLWYLAVCSKNILLCDFFYYIKNVTFIYIFGSDFLRTYSLEVGRKLRSFWIS